MESFLHKDVSFVITGSQECLKEQNNTDNKAGAKGTSEETQRPLMSREPVLSSDKRRPGTPRPVVISITHAKFSHLLQLTRLLVVKKNCETLLNLIIAQRKITEKQKSSVRSEIRKK